MVDGLNMHTSHVSWSHRDSVANDSSEVTRATLHSPQERVQRSRDHYTLVICHWHSIEPLEAFETYEKWQNQTRTSLLITGLLFHCMKSTNTYN